MIGLLGYIAGRDALRGLSRAAWPDTRRRRPAAYSTVHVHVIVPTNEEHTMRSERSDTRDYPRAEEWKPTRVETIHAADPKAGMDLDELARALDRALTSRRDLARDARRATRLAAALADIDDLIGGAFAAEPTLPEAVTSRLREIVQHSAYRDIDGPSDSGPVDGRSPRLKVRVTGRGRLKALTIERP